MCVCVCAEHVLAGGRPVPGLWRGIFSLVVDRVARLTEPPGFSTVLRLFMTVWAGTSFWLGSPQLSFPLAFGWGVPTESEHKPGVWLDSFMPVIPSWKLNWF